MSFSNELGKFRTKAIANVEKERKAVCVELFRSVIQDTPVDTGRAKGNWQTSVDSPIRSTTDRVDKTGGAAIAEMMANLGEGDCTVHLTNNLPYISKLEFGSSKQSPTGMVRKNLARIKALILRKRLSK